MRLFRIAVLAVATSMVASGCGASVSASQTPTPAQSGNIGTINAFSLTPDMCPKNELNSGVFDRHPTARGEASPEDAARQGADEWQKDGLIESTTPAGVTRGTNEVTYGYTSEGKLVAVLTVQDNGNGWAIHTTSNCGKG